MNKNEVIRLSLIRPIAKLLVPTKCQLRLADDPDGDVWNDYKMHGQKITIHDDKLIFRDTGVLFTLKRDILSMLTDDDFKKTDSPDAKQFINFLNEMNFDTHAQEVKILETTTS